MSALFSMVDERCVVAHQESETDRGLLFNRRTFDTGIIQCCGQAVNFIVTAGQVIAVAGTYNDHLLYFQPDELNLSKGTKVRITGGDFEGQEGVFLKVKGARDRRVVIAIQGVIAVAMATIHPDLIEVIK